MQRHHVRGLAGPGGRAVHLAARVCFCEQCGVALLSESVSLISGCHYITSFPPVLSSNGVSWTFTKCDFDDFNGYADKADEVLTTVRGIKMENYRYA